LGGVRVFLGEREARSMFPHYCIVTIC
jgi:hypothetical protein